MIRVSGMFDWINSKDSQASAACPSAAVQVRSGMGVGVSLPCDSGFMDTVLLSLSGVRRRLEAADDSVRTGSILALRVPICGACGCLTGATECEGGWRVVSGTTLTASAKHSWRLPKDT